MKKRLIIVGLIGLFFGVYIFDYIVEGTPIISLVSGIILLYGILSKDTQKSQPVQQSTNETPKNPLGFCPKCGEILFPEQRFCGMCGINVENQIEPQSYVPDYKNRVSVVDTEASVNIVSNIGKAFSNLFRVREPLVSVSDTIYEKLPPLGIFGSFKLLLISLVLFAGFYILLLGEDLFSVIDANLMYFIATYGLALIYLLWVYRSDRYEREPFRFIILLFAWGVFSGVIAMLFNEIFAPFFQSTLGNAALVAPFVEEPAKAMGLYWLASHKKYGKEFNTPLDGIIYGFAAGLGFFAMENFSYFLNFDESILVMRSFLTWTHGLWVATTGLWLAVAKVKRGRLTRWDLLPGLSIAIFLHFLWNGWSGWLGAAAIGPMGIQLIHHLWYSRRIIKEALRDEVSWGYATGRAPLE